MRPFEKNRENRSNAAFDAVLASAELVDHYLKISDAATNVGTKRDGREAAIKIYRSIFRTIDNATFTRQQIGVINQKMSILRARLL